MPARLSGAQRRAVFDLLRGGHDGMQTAVLSGVSKSQVYRMLDEVGGVIPRQRVYSARFLDRDERYEIARLHDGGASIRLIGRRLARDPGTISRELERNGDPRTGRYQPERAQSLAEGRQARPKQRKLQRHPQLRDWVQDRLDQKYSPVQIAGRLVVEFPDDEQMRISHESIYQGIYVRAGGQLKRELRAHLRTHRTTRTPRSTRQPRGQIKDMISIHERPDEVADRLIPGHHEGDLIMGSTASNSAIGTIVERTTGFLTLLHLPEGHTADAVADAITTTLPELLPAAMRKTLTWDQGHEMARHARITDTIGINVYFADPHAPWQRGSNENTNGLLRQYFPKGTDLTTYSAADLRAVSTQMNDRPRKRLGFLTPAEVMHKLIHDDLKNAGVATILEPGVAQRPKSSPRSEPGRGSQAGEPGRAATFGEGERNSREGQVRSFASSAATQASCSCSFRRALRGSQKPAITKISGMNTTSPPTAIQKYFCHCLGESPCRLLHAGRRWPAGRSAGPDHLRVLQRRSRTVCRKARSAARHRGQRGQLRHAPAAPSCAARSG